MGKKGAQPALYEKMRMRAAATLGTRIPAAPPAAEPAPRVSPLEPAESTWLSPGRTIRLPVGYLLLAGGLAILLMTLVYMAGHSRGQATARSEFEKNYSRSIGEGDLNDPLGSLEPLVPPEGQGSSGKGVLVPQNGGSGAANANRPSPPGQWGPVEPKSNPRVKGLNYLVLMETTRDGAVRFAEFCRANGLETYVIPAKNSDRRRRVIAFPGYEPSNQKARGAVESKIERISDLWQKADKDNEAIRGAYAVDVDS